MRYSLVAVSLLLVGSVSACWAQTPTTKAADPLGPVRAHMRVMPLSLVHHVYRTGAKLTAVPFVSMPVIYTPWYIPPSGSFPAKTPQGKR